MIGSRHAPKDVRAAEVALKAAESAIRQRRRGARPTARDLYYEAHGLLRTFRHYFIDAGHVRRRAA